MGGTYGGGVVSFPMPKRVQRKRTKGWRMPDNTVYVGRPGGFGNPLGTASAFRVWTEMPGPGRIIAAIARRDWKGKDLACWCPLDQACHADVLLEIANSEVAE